MDFRSDYTARPTTESWIVVHKPSQKVIATGFWNAKAAWDYIRYITGKIYNW